MLGYRRQQEGSAWIMISGGIRTREKRSYLRRLAALFVLLMGIMLLYIFIILPSLRDDIYQERMLHTREMVDIGLSVLQRYYNLEQRETISSETARKEAARLVRSLRYGEEDLDYFWISDVDHRLIVHPFRPELEGEDVYDYEDPEGFPLFQEFVDISREEGEGHVSYSWQYYDQAGRYEEKLSYVAAFEPWDWIIGTGVYLSDMEAVIAARRNIALVFTGLFFLITSGLLLFYYRIKETEQELLESEEKYRLIADNTADIISILDLNFRYLYVSPAVKKIKGFTPDEAVSKTLEETMTSYSLKKFFRLYDKNIAPVLQGVNCSEKIYYLETEEYTSDDSTVILDNTITLLHNKAGKPIGILIVSKDVTEQKKQQAAMEKEKHEKELILDNLDEMVKYMDHEMRVLWANPAVSRGHSIKPEEFIGQKCYEAFMGLAEPCAECLCLQAMQKGEICRGEVHSPDDRYWQVTAAPVQDEQGRVTGVLEASLEITGLKLAEQELKKLNEELEQRVRERTAELEWANKELSAFTYSVSHDLRAPLRSIKGFSEALLEDYQSLLDEEGKDYLGRIVSSSYKMSELIDDLLKLSRVTRQEIFRDRIDLSAMVEASAAYLKETEPERKVEFMVEPGQVATGDAALLRIAIDNLMSNAWKFTADSSSPRIEFGAVNEHGTKIYYITDNGIGFEMSYAEKIFDAFQRLHSYEEYSGTGIGLSIVQRIIERHGGRIWAEGKPGRGATFYFVLPD